ncbi:MAG: response regulator transcription factor [Sutterella sp.]|jgi:FixJ family two-component response regulator|nr:response regulator transcription factor [Sutterella sp.]
MANTEIPEITDDIKAKCLIRTVDDDPAMREALEFMLTAEGWRVKTYENGRAFLTDDAPSTPGCAILDVRMPGMSGLELQQEMNVRGYALPIIFLTGNGDIDMAVSAMRDGAVDFVQKPVRQERLLKAIARAVTRSVSETGAVETEGAIRAKVQELTDREREIAELIGKKLTNRQISERTGITVRTVEVHRAAIIRKLGVRNPDEIERYLNA